MPKKTETKPTNQTKPTRNEQLPSIAIDDLEWITGGEGGDEVAVLQSGHSGERA